MRVKATREGLLGHRTSSNWPINEHVPFVALPSVAALRQLVVVRNPLVIDQQTGAPKTVCALVLDVGPHFENDDKYVFGGQRPLAETARDASGNQLNGAGIDLGELVWNQLGMKDNTSVDWVFLFQLGQVDAKGWDAARRFALEQFAS